jgi:hypothetical protein
MLILSRKTRRGAAGYSGPVVPPFQLSAFPISAFALRNSSLLHENKVIHATHSEARSELPTTGTASVPSSGSTRFRPSKPGTGDHWGRAGRLGPLGFSGVVALKEAVEELAGDVLVVLNLFVEFEVGVYQGMEHVLGNLLERETDGVFGADL